MLRVIIKGNIKEAEAAAERHGVTFVGLKEHNTDLRSETVGLAPDEDQEKIMSWFAEDVSDGPPFPAGSCLWHGKNEGVI